LIILLDVFLKKITAAGKNPVTTVPAAISILLLIMRKNINTILSPLLSPRFVERLAMYVTKQPEHYNKNHNTSQTASSPFPSGIAGDQ